MALRTPVILLLPLDLPQSKSAAVQLVQEIESNMSPYRKFVRHCLRYDGCAVQPVSPKPKGTKIMSRRNFSGILLIASSVFAAVAADKPHCSGPNTSVEPKQIDAAFERFKRLAGDWEAAGAKSEAQKGKTQCRYHLTAGGSALVETVFPGEDMEMVTVYHCDGDQLMLTHYCHLGNQPRMRTKEVESTKEIVFDLVGGGNLDPGKDTHMHTARFRFIDDDHFQTEWQLYRQGKPVETYKFDLVRKKP
jgi:hypothetical protein